MHIRELSIAGFERVVVARDDRVGYHGIVAIHSLRLGPALGGSRLLAYESEQAALDDALRLAEGMSLKSAFARLPFGGGKAVIIAPPSPTRAELADLFRAHGELVETFRGDFVTGEDVGTTPADMTYVRQATMSVLVESPVTVDSASAAARGVHRAIEGALVATIGSLELLGLVATVQGCGMVGRVLAELLANAGATLTVSDTVAERAEACARATGAQVVAPADVLSEPCDIVAPCALGGVFDDRSVTRLRTRIVAGAANNQLRSDEVALRMHERGIHYVPDFVANAGGVIAAATDLLGWSRQAVFDQIDAIRNSVADLVARAASEGTTPHAVALDYARTELAQ